MSTSPQAEPTLIPADDGPHGTLRAWLTGMTVGGVLALCTVYSGL